MRNVLSDLGPLYHNYKFFGVNNDQLPGIYALNQAAKAPIITAYIAAAIAKSRETSNQKVSFSEWFCADGYYAMVASRLGCEPAIGIDSNRDGHLPNANKIAQRLGVSNVLFMQEQIAPGRPLPVTDIIANVGGLYHVENPEEILQLSLQRARKFLIVQSVVSLADHSDEYFEAPAPGWSWGSRYSRESFDKMIRRNCDDIVDSHFNELLGNSAPEHRGSVYYLIRKSGEAG